MSIILDVVICFCIRALCGRVDVGLSISAVSAEICVSLVGSDVVGSDVVGSDVVGSDVVFGLFGDLL